MPGIAMVGNDAGMKIEGQYLDQLIPSLKATYKDPLSDCEEGAAVSTSLVWTFIFGFIGGLLTIYFHFNWVRRLYLGYFSYS